MSDFENKPQVGAQTTEAENIQGDPNEKLTDELMKASRLLLQRRRSLRDESKAQKEQDATRQRALKLLALKPSMQQSELAELMGERLRVVDALLAELEIQGFVTRIQPDEPDMRIVSVTLTPEGTTAATEGFATAVTAELAPGFSDAERDALTAQLAQLNAALEALGLRDDERSRSFGRNGRDGRNGGFRGGRDSNDREGRGRNRGNYNAPGHDGTRHTQSARYERGGKRDFGSRSRGKGFGNRSGRGQGSSN